MHDLRDDIIKQARQGSVAAIIQVLNEKLADTGVRTRAVFAEGVLELLCEAAIPEQLEQSSLVEQIRQILEDIAPRNIRRVKINSRIVREQQLLWLEEINRDPNNQLLWSEKILLAKPNFFKQLTQSFQDARPVTTKKAELLKISARKAREKTPFRRGIVSGISLSLLLMLIGWLLYEQLNSKLSFQISPQASSSLAKYSPKLTTSQKVMPSPASDSFAEAVRLAEQAANAGQSVQTAAQWLDLAANWERAADLMKTVKPNDPRYKTAQDRMRVYRQNSKTAQNQASRRRS